MEANAHFVLANALLLFASASAGRLAMAGREPWRRALATVSAYPVLVTVVMLAIGSAGLLTARWATIASALAALALGVPAYRSRLRAPAAGPAQEHRRLEDVDRLLLLLCGAMLAAMGAVYVGYALASGCVLKPDDLSYHAVQPAHWIVHQRLTLGFGTYQSYYPHGSEMLSAWFMLPFRCDAMASLGALVWLALATVAVTGLARALGAGRGAALLPAVILLASAPVLRRLNTFSATDLAAPAAALAALAFLALPTRRARDGRPRTVGWRDVLCSGVCCGLAIGAKASLTPLAALLPVWLMWRVARLESVKVAAAKSAAWIGGALATGGYWYVRNTVLTGNPLFPVAVGPFPGPFGPEEQRPSRLVAWLTDPPAGTDWSVLGDYLFDWPVGLLALSLIGYGACVAALQRRAGAGEERGDRALAGLLGAVGVILVMAFPFAPFSATSEWPAAPLQAQTRYVLLSYLIGVALFALSVAGDGAARRLWAGLALLTSAVAFAATIGGAGGGAARGLTLAVLALGAVGAAAARAWRAEPRWRPLHAAPLAAAALLVLAALQPLKAERSDAGFASAVTRADSAAEPRDMAPLLDALADLPPGTRVAWFQPNPSFCYWAFGRRLQLEPLLVGADGAPRPPLHALWRQRPEAPWWVLAGSLAEAPARQDPVVGNLRAAGVEAVVVTRWRGEEWPGQRAQLAQTGGASAVWKDEVAELWRL